jgi:hypothetical protein
LGLGHDDGALSEVLTRRQHGPNDPGGFIGHRSWLCDEASGKRPLFVIAAADRS